MNVHNLKIRPNYFKDVIAEIKKFEIRFNDRGFEVGDLIVLEEFDNKGYTGRYVNAEMFWELN